MNTLDARGLSCPEPVIMIKNAVDAHTGEILPREGSLPGRIRYMIMTDNRTSLENITRFGEHNGFSVTYTTNDGDYTITLEKQN